MKLPKTMGIRSSIGRDMLCWSVKEGKRGWEDHTILVCEATVEQIRASANTSKLGGRGNLPMRDSQAEASMKGGKENTRK
jgi:hypothetical protein